MRGTDLLAGIVVAAVATTPGAIASGEANATVSRSLVEQCYNYYTDIDMPGYDWYKIGAGSVLACRIQCIIEDNCKAFTWTNQNGGTCYVKTGYNTKGAKYVQGAVTGIKGCNANLLTVLNCDMGGNDVANERAPSVDECVLGCIARDPPDCNAWTWSDYNGGTCWLKSRVSKCQGDGNNKYSGVIGPQNWY